MHQEQTHYRKVITLVICFTLTSILIYWQPSSKAVQKKIPLSQALSDIKGWKSDGLTPLDPKIVESLKLDDYVNQTYSNGNNTVSLYIGYYLTTKKVGAAHDPLVCFSGQGWVLSIPTNPDTDSNPFRTPIPIESGHLFQSKADTYSKAKRTPPNRSEATLKNL